MPDMINPMKSIREDLGKTLEDKSAFFLTSILFVLAVAILYIAFFQKNRLLKIGTILWVCLP